MSQELNLNVLHDAILAAIRVKFPALQTVEDYGAPRKSLKVPAVLVELMDMEADPDDDPGTEQLAVVSKWAARVVIGARQENEKREVRKLAAALGAFIQNQRWGQPVNAAKVTVIGPDAFDPDFDKYEVWAVEWDQQIDLGESVWTGEGITPERVMIGFAPDIGPGQEPEYFELEGGAA